MESIAVVGTGIAGMGAAYFLRGRCDVTFYERNDYPGGHTNTLTIDEDGHPVYIDSGFIVYNQVTYPHLCRLFDELGVVTMDTSMSFSVQDTASGLEYCGTGLNGLFAQRRNLLSPRYWRMLMDMKRFNEESPDILDDDYYQNHTIADYVREKGLGQDFLNKFLVPMSSAVWSMEPDLMLNFPAVTLVRFFKNHGFLGLTTHFQWRTVTGGSRNYRDKILSLFPGKVLLNTPVTKVIRWGDKVLVEDGQGGRRTFDRLILASHADEALAVLAEPTGQERELLGSFSYSKNRAVLHTDASLMPKIRRAWSSWNYRIQPGKQGRSATTTIYWMNGLQKVSQKKDYFLSINDPGLINPAKILWTREYHHPVYNVAAVKAQEHLPRLNHQGRVYFCGSYFRYGFHEDALTAGLNAARAVLGERIWE